MEPIKTLVIIITLYAILALAFAQEHEERHHSYLSNELIVSEPEDPSPGNKNYENQGAQVDILQLVAPTEVPQNKQNYIHIYGADLKNRDSQVNQTKENQKESQHVQQTQSYENQTEAKNQTIENDNLGLINQTDQSNRGNQSKQNNQSLDKEIDVQLIDDNNDIENDTKTSTSYPILELSSCNYETDPTLSCADCTNRIICKQEGALLKKCYNPDRPYCNQGRCSATPTDGCEIY